MAERVTLLIGSNFVQFGGGGGEGGFYVVAPEDCKRLAIGQGHFKYYSTGAYLINLGGVVNI